jgi:hypothetical protein
MSQAILISDNEVTNSLYEVNLRAYVGTNVTIKKTIDGAIKLIEQSPNVDAIICFRELNKKDDAIGALGEYLREHKLNIPIVVLGEPTKPIEKCIIIKNKYDIKGLLRAMAKIMEITAKEMAEKEVPQFFPIPIKLFGAIEKSHCDIYYRNQKEDFDYEYYVIIEKDVPIQDKLKKYADQGVDKLFIDANERLRFINRASGVIVEELERDDLTMEDRVTITAQGMGVVAEEVFDNPEVSDEVANISMACIKSVSQVAKDVPKLKSLLQMLVEQKDDYVYMHSVLTTYIATNIIKNISWGSNEQAEKISFALFFHDIYLVPIFKKYPNAISEEDLLFRDDVDEKR